MNIKLETIIAIRYFRSRRDESFISISSLFSFLGITIGVATLIIVMSVMNGFRAQLIDKIVGINLFFSVVANMNMLCFGGSSRVFKNALADSRFIRSASSKISTR